MGKHEHIGLLMSQCIKICRFAAAHCINFDGDCAANPEKFMDKDRSSKAQRKLNDWRSSSVVEGHILEQNRIEEHP